MINLSRRGFLGAIIAAAVAPAIVRSGLIMPIKPQLIIPEIITNIERGGLILMTRSTATDALQYRWVRERILGEVDHLNMTLMANQGWVPVASTERAALVTKGLLSA